MGPRKPQQRPEKQTIRTVLLLTNGIQTEKNYLTRIDKSIDQQHVSTKVHATGGEPGTILSRIRTTHGKAISIDDYDKVWIVIDQDGKDRGEFIQECRSLSKRKKVEIYVVISNPCFEVWLNAHYGNLKNYADQKEAQRHYLGLTGLSKGRQKEIPKNFPWDNAQEAAHRCFLPPGKIPEVNTQGPCPSTSMPHLLKRLGFIELDEKK